MKIRAVLVSATLLFGCAKAPAEKVKTPTEEPGPLDIAAVLPLEDRTVSSFRSTSDSGETGSFVLEIFRPRADLAHLVIAGRTQRLIVAPDHVSHAGGGDLLRAPLVPGRKFRGAFGEVTITSVNVEIDVPAGHLKGCVVTREENPAQGRVAESTYCRAYGLVQLVVETSDGDALRLENVLVSHGPRVDLGPAP